MKNKILLVSIFFSSQVFAMEETFYADLFMNSVGFKYFMESKREEDSKTIYQILCKYFEKQKPNNHTLTEILNHFLSNGDFKNLKIIIESIIQKYPETVVQCLMEACNNVNNNQNTNYKAIVILAQMNPIGIKYLTNYCKHNNIKLDVNARDEFGWTPLIIASVYHSETIKYLTNYCKYNNIKLDVNAKNNDGYTAYDFALHYKPEAVKYLIDYCQSNNIQLNVNAKNNNGSTDLKEAAGR